MKVEERDRLFRGRLQFVCSRLLVFSDFAEEDSEGNL